MPGSRRARGRVPAASPSIKDVLLEERLVGYLDPGAEEYLLKINGAGVATSSSCTGRITIVEGRWHWLRDEARIVYKTHKEIEPEALARVLSRPFGDLWLKVTGPIIHARVPSLECAMKVLEVARSAGFKHSGVLHASPEEGYVIELLSAVQISLPLKLEGRYVVSPAMLGELARMANEALHEGWSRLGRLADSLLSLPCPAPPQPQEHLDRRPDAALGHT